jgi:phosphoribosylglycinamide formyltransferase-1
MNLGVLVSGRGSNLQAILDAVQAGKLDASVKVVVSNLPGAQALDRAARAGVPTQVISHRSYPSRGAFETALLAELHDHGVEWVVLAGFMRVLTQVFIGAYAGRIINIHPALLPAFPGVHAQRQALEYGVKVSGCTVHLIDEGVDTGPILAQRVVPVLEDDDEAALSARILAEEHELLVDVLRGIASGRLDPARARRRPCQG